MALASQKVLDFLRPSKIFKIDLQNNPYNTRNSMKSQIKNKKTEEYICWITDTKIMNFHEGETVLSKKCMGWLF